jgi:integrase
MAGIRNSHARPPVQKEAVLAEAIIAMVSTLDRGSLRDRAMLLIGSAGGLRRSEIVGATSPIQSSRGPLIRHEREMEARTKPTERSRDERCCLITVWVRYWSHRALGIRLRN